MFKHFSFVFILCVIGVGCSTHRSEPLNLDALKDIGKIGVVPFENYSSNANAGLILSDQLANELMVSSKLDIVNPEAIRSALAPHAGKIWTAQKIGKLLKVDTVITGTVTEYRYKNGISQEPVISLTVYMVRVKDGKVIWSANTSKGDSSIFEGSGLGALAQNRCAMIVKELLSAKPEPIKAKRRNR